MSTIGSNVLNSVNGSAAAQADIHRRTTQRNKFRPDGNFTLLSMLSTNIA